MKGLVELEKDKRVVKMGWNYPEISFEEMVNLVKGFVDILILASGYQSSGLLATWDADNMKKAFQWGIFFENVLRNMTSKDMYRDSVRELDEALCKMKSDPSFPQALANLSSDTLSRARDFILEHLINSLQLRDEHLRAILEATTEAGNDVMNFTVQVLLKRQSAISCISALETSLDIISKSIEGSVCKHSDCSFWQEHLKQDEAPAIAGREQKFVEIFMWNHWKSRSLSYLLSKRTLRLVSGASLIFSAPKIQWLQVLGRLCFSSVGGCDILIEKIELLLIGCVASRWSQLLEHFMSVSSNSTAMSEQHDSLCKTLHQTLQSSNYRKDTSDSKVNDILEYLTKLLGGQLHHLWKLPPALVAAAIPPWSSLFPLYFNEIEKQLKVGFSTTRCCSCNQDKKEHKDCELAERLWCLYICHVHRPHLMLAAEHA